MRKKKTALNIQVVFVELWLLSACIVLLPIIAWFLFYHFKHLFIAYWWICLYLYRNHSIKILITITWLVSAWAVEVLRVWYYVPIIPDRYLSVPVFISDRPSASIGTEFLRHDFHNGEGLERSDSESDARCIG